MTTDLLKNRYLAELAANFPNNSMLNPLGEKLRWQSKFTRIFYPLLYVVVISMGVLYVVVISMGVLYVEANGKFLASLYLGEDDYIHGLKVIPGK